MGHRGIAALLTSKSTVNLAWTVVGLVIWLISLGTCLVCEAGPEAIDLGYAQHESARGTTEGPRR